MARLMLVRHAEPTASWGTHPDPGLSADGHHQADEVASVLAHRGPAAIATSPLRRAHETAAPLAARWTVTARVEPEVGEIPTPPALATSRTDWLRGVLAGCWADVEADARRWRAGLLRALQAIDEPTVVFTHFVAINAAVGAATGDDRVRSCSPDYASITELDADVEKLTLVALGAQSASRIG